MVHGTGFGGTNFCPFADPATAGVSHGSAPRKKAESVLEVRLSRGCSSQVLGCWVRMVLVGYGPHWEISQKHPTTQNPLDVCALQHRCLCLQLGCGFYVQDSYLIKPGKEQLFSSALYFGLENLLLVL